MLNPIRLVNDLFDDEKLSDADLRSFTEDHLVRLSQTENNPGGIYNTLITDTTTKYNAYYGRITNETTKKGIAEGTTATRNQARKVVEEKISNLQGLVKYKFGETSGTYQEFYPHGASEYQNAREGDVGTLFDSFVTASATHLTADYPADVTAITNLVASFHTAYSAREAAAAQVDIIGTGKQEDRIQLTLQLTTNFLTIALNNLLTPNKFQDYYNPFYLPITDGPETFNGTIEVNSIITAVPAGHITNSSSLVFENKGNGQLIFSLSDTPDTLNPNVLITVEVDQRLRFNEKLPVLSAYYVIIQNQSLTKNGSWHVEVS